MNKIKEYKGIIIIVLAILGISFYWYEWRPTQIKEKCFAEAEFDNRAMLENNDVKRQEFIDSYYKDCLMRFGLKS